MSKFDNKKKLEEIRVGEVADKIQQHFFSKGAVSSTKDWKFLVEILLEEQKANDKKWTDRVEGMRNNENFGHIGNDIDKIHRLGQKLGHNQALDKLLSKEEA